jgi:hypothetical protein
MFLLSYAGVTEKTRKKISEDSWFQRGYTNPRPPEYNNKFWEELIAYFP